MTTTERDCHHLGYDRKEVRLSANNAARLIALQMRELGQPVPPVVVITDDDGDELMRLDMPMG